MNEYFIVFQCVDLYEDGNLWPPNLIVDRVISDSKKKAICEGYMLNVLNDSKEGRDEFELAVAGMSYEEVVCHLKTFSPKVYAGCQRIPERITAADADWIVSRLLRGSFIYEALYLELSVGTRIKRVARKLIGEK